MLQRLTQSAIISTYTMSKSLSESSFRNHQTN